MSFTLAAQTAYQDLLETRKMWAVSESKGTPFLKDQDKKGQYWYARQRIGGRVIDTYIGPNTPDLRAQIDTLKSKVHDQKAIEARCSSLVAQLRAAGLPALDRSTGKVLNAMAKVGVFRLGGTLVGTHAFRLFSAELGARLDNTLAATEDIDVAAFENLKLVIDDTATPSLASTFKALKLDPAPGIDAKRRPTRWIMQGGGTMVDFLAPKMQDKSDIVMLETLGVYAQALPFLNYLIADPIPAVGLYRSGILVQIPRPERYAIHKLILSQRRSSASKAKSRKDIAQAETLISILSEDRPQELLTAFQDAMDIGLSWRAALTAALKQKPALRAVLKQL